MIKRRDGVKPQPLGDGDQARVDAAKAIVCVLLGQVNYAFPVRNRQRLDLNLARSDHPVEPRLESRSELTLDEPSGFGDHERRREQSLRYPIQELDAPSVIAVAAIRVREEDARVDQ